jgi:hypothetical protein
MTLRDFRIGWRALAQEPFYSLVVIAGLGIGLAASLLLLGFVRYSLEYNRHVPDVDHVYVVKQRFNADPVANWYDLAPVLLRTAAAQTPGVLETTAYIPVRPQGSRFAVKVDGKLHQVDGVITLPGFVRMLGLQALQGDLEHALDQPESLVISEALAQRVFGTPDALGRTLQAEGKALRVTAVLRTPPANSTIPFEALVGVHSALVDDMMRTELLSGEHGWWGKLLVRVQPGASVPAITAALQQALDESPFAHSQRPEVRARLGQRKIMDVALSPLSGAYFDREVADNHISGKGQRADPATVAGLALLAVLITALAATNYANLAAVRIVRRQREVAVRKVLGASARQLVLQLLAESLLVSMLATTLGLLLAWLALPLFSELMDRKLDSVLSAANIGTAIGIGVLLAVLTAVYPAWIAMRVHPAAVLAGKPDMESRQGMLLRRTLTMLQVASAICIAAVTLAIAWQTAYAMRAAPGFDPLPLLVIDLPEEGLQNGQSELFASALAGQAGVSVVARSDDAVGRGRMSFTREWRRPGGATMSADVKAVNASFFEAYGLRPLAGRLFEARRDREADAGLLVLNARAARALGFVSPSDAVGQALQYAQYDGKVVSKRVVGIAPDVRFRPLREAPRAVVYELSKIYGGAVTVRAGEPLPQLEARLYALWPRFFPGSLPSIQRAGDILAANYADEARMSSLLGVATAIAMVIAAFGTYVLTAYTVQRRAKEIVLRKLHGAGQSAIGLLVLRDSGALLLAAALIALPLAAVLIERYLAGFVERAPATWWSLPAALAAAGLVALSAMARHIRAAMQIRPADVLAH